MASPSAFSQKLNDLETRLKEENEARKKDKKTIDFRLDSPARNFVQQEMGSPLSASPRDKLSYDFRLDSPKGRKPAPLSDLGLGENFIRTPSGRKKKEFVLPGTSPVYKSHVDSAEIDKKLQEIYQQTGVLTIGGKKYKTMMKDLEDLGEIGNGTCGHVAKMLHKETGHILAVKQMRRSGNKEENKRILMDLDVVLKSHDCPYIVQCSGAIISDTDVWICMELMSTCLEKLIKKLNGPIPEKIIGKMAVAIVKALNYLKEMHGVIHRDVKPSNVLLDEKGTVKLCDFGISGRLVDSKAKTRSAGCAAYMAPERIDPPDPHCPDYDIRADVWSLGISLVELAIGEFPYKNCKTDFEVLTKVLQEEPPSLPANMSFSMDFRSFVHDCLIKDYKQRPKYKQLLQHNFMKRYETLNVDVACWFAGHNEESDNEASTPSDNPITFI